VLALVGLMMVTGSYAALAGMLAGMGQLVNLEIP
jgi:hypothetical protein